MPLYEYRCGNCRRGVTILIRNSSESPTTCPECGSTELERIFSKFSVRKSDQTVYEDILSDHQLTRGLMQDDPRALAEWNKKMSQGTEGDITPEHSEMLDRMEAGEMPAKPTKKDEASKE